MHEDGREDTRIAKMFAKIADIRFSIRKERVYYT